jgi:hypothetical protein
LTEKAPDAPADSRLGLPGVESARLGQPVRREAVSNRFSKEDNPMRVVLLRVLPLTLLVIALVTIISGCSQSYAGRLVSADEGKITVAEGPKGEAETHKVAPDAKVILNGKPAEPKDLQPGDAVKVTTELKSTGRVAVAIDAKRPAEGAASPGAKLPKRPDLKGERPKEPSKESRPGEAERPVLPNLPAAPSKEPSEQSPAGKANPPEEKMIPSEQNGPKALPPGKDSAKEGGSRKPARSGDAQRAPGAKERSALPAEALPTESLFTGKITFVGPDILRLRGHSGPEGLPEEMTFTVTAQTKIQLLGERASIGELKSGMEATVVAERKGDQVIAKRVDVKSVTT